MTRRSGCWGCWSGYFRFMLDRQHEPKGHGKCCKYSKNYNVQLTHQYLPWSANASSIYWPGTGNRLTGIYSSMHKLLHDDHVFSTFLAFVGMSFINTTTTQFGVLISSVSDLNGIRWDHMYINLQLVIVFSRYFAIFLYVTCEIHMCFIYGCGVKTMNDLQ